MVDGEVEPRIEEQERRERPNGIERMTEGTETFPILGWIKDPSRVKVCMIA
jgi:hypothetical protein